VSLVHQVFVSHATEDLETARRVCKVLEADGISCWLATRDVKAGTDYAAAILDAIRNSSLVLLIFSSHANTSPYVLREIERAIAYDRPVLSLRVDEALPGSSMEYYLNLWQWLDVQKGVEKQRQEIIVAVRKQLDKVPGQAPNAGERPRAAERVGTVGPRRSSRRTWGIAIVGALVVVTAAGIGTWAAMRGTSTPGASSSTVGSVTTTSMASSTTPSTSTVASSSSLSLLPNIHTTWTELKPSGELPIGRGGQSMAYDPAGGRVIMFGGYYGGGSSGLDETWAYDPKANSWTNLDPPGAVPSARFGSSMVYDPVTRRMIMFGGAEADLSGVFNDTWAYDPAANTWTELKPAGTLPLRRGHQATAYDPATHRMIIFGGNGRSSHFNDTWAYDPAANTWTELKPTGTVPPPRGQQWMVYDTSNDQVIMFGGVGDGELDDTWAYDPAANTWTQLKPKGTLPHPRFSAPMVYCTSSGQVIMFGGGYTNNGAFGFLNDTWAFDPDSHVWTLLAPQGTLPSARASSMVYDPATGQVIMFGGGGSSDILDDTWDYTP
jgi:N-acetylneuraminic acid mutarotase